MSGFFSLGRKQQEQEQDHQADTNYSFFLSKNEEICNKGFELWQQYNQQRTHTHHHHNIQDVNFSIGPGPSTSNIGNAPSNYSYTSAEAQGFRAMSGNDDVGMINCQDCGNQAKKDCEYMRCRTCCKSRGFPCHTHVRSTWVPAARRREKQPQTMTTGGENPKRLRDNPPGGGGGFELGQFPSEVNSSAVFRCVKVSAMGEADETMAYQTAVNIGGHVFKGILYDQGPESHYLGGGGGGGEGSSRGGGSQQNLIGAGAPTSSGTVAANSNVNVSMLNVDPSSIYPNQLSGFMTGTQYFLPPRP